MEIKKALYVDYVNKFRWFILSGGALITLGLAYYAITLFGSLSGGGFTDPASESTRISKLFENKYYSPAPDIVVVLQYPGVPVATNTFETAFRQFKSKLITNLPKARSIIDYFDYKGATGLISLDGYKTVMTFRIPDAFKYSLDDFQKAVSGTPLTALFGGSQLSTKAITEQLGIDLAKIEEGSIPVLLFILVFAYGGIVAISVPILLALWTLVLTLSALHLVSIGFNVTSYVTNVATAFGVGIAIDYSIFMHLRFTEEFQKRKNLPKQEISLVEIVDIMMATSGRTILFSAILLVTTLSGALLFNMYYLTTMAVGVMFIAAFAALGSLTIVPAFYLVMGEKIFYLSTQPLLTYISTQLVNLQKYLIETCFKGTKDTTSLAVVPITTTQESHMNSIESIESQQAYNMNESNKTEDNPIVTKNSQSNRSLVYITHHGLNMKELNKEIDEKDIWFRSIRYVVDHPIAFLIPVLACLITLTVYFCKDVKLASFGLAAIPIDSPVRKTFEITLYEFRSVGSSQTDIYIETLPHLKVTDPLFVTDLDSFCTTLESYPFVTSVNSMVRLDSSLNLTRYLNIYADPYSSQNMNYTAQVLDPFYYSDLKHIARVSLSSSLSVSDDKLGGSVRRVRKLLKQSFRYTSNSTSYLANSGVTGSGPTQYDTIVNLRRTLPGFIAVIVCAMAIFVLVLTGSIFLPIKAIVTSGISITSSFAFLMFVFQNNNGADFLNFRNDFNCLDPIQLLFVFVVAFGLSLDYEVFILGRIQEIYELTGDNKYAIAKGVSSSARAVTIAAVLICTAIGGFLASQVLILKMIGMGIGVTIILDATIMRCILIPAIMSLCGEYTWYAPQFIKKSVAYLGLQEKSL